MTTKASENLDLWADGSVDVKGLNREYGVSKSRAYEWMAAGRLPYTMTSGRRLIPRRAMKLLLASGLVGVTNESTERK